MANTFAGARRAACTGRCGERCERLQNKVQHWRAFRGKNGWNTSPMLVFAKLSGEVQCALPPSIACVRGRANQTR